MVAIGIPILILEMYLGNNSQIKPHKYFKQSPVLKPLRQLPFVTNFLILSFYSVIAAWVLMSLCISVRDLVLGSETMDYSGVISHPVWLSFMSLGFMGITGYVCFKGVRAGIDKLNVVVMPALLGILIALVVYCGFEGYLSKGFTYMFAFGKVDLTWNLFTGALGHAFFTLSLGTGVIWTYGQYIQREGKRPIQSCVKHSLIIAAADTGFALLVGLIIFSVMLGANMEIVGVPDLIFRALPVVFSKIPFGPFIEVVFFLLVFFCALTSSVSLFEVMRKQNTKRETVRLVLLTSAMSVLTVLSLSDPKAITILGATPFVHFDNVTTRMLMPFFGLLVFCIATYELVFARLRMKKPVPVPVEE